MKKSWKRSLSLLVAVVMVLAMLPVYTFAAETTAATVEIGGVTTKYDTLDDAIAAANVTGTTATIKVMKNTTLNKGYLIDRGVNLTIDLNGYTVTVAGTNLYNGGTQVFNLRASSSGVFAQLTITDTSANKTGVIDVAAATTLQHFIRIENDGVFTLAGGKITNVTSATAGAVVKTNKAGAKFVMTGGEISGNECTGGSIVYVGYGEFVMSGGKISGNTVPSGKYAVERATGTLSLSGSAKLNSTNAAAASITLGELTEGAEIVSVNRLTTNATAVEAGSGPYTYTYNAPPVPAAMVGETPYETLAEAIDAALNAGTATVKVMKDTALTKGYLVDYSKHLTIDLNGNTVTIPGTNLYNSGYVFQLRAASNGAIAKLTITDTKGGGEFTAEGTTGIKAFVRIENDGVFTLAGGKITGVVGSENGSVVKLNKSGAQFVMTGGEISGNTSTAGAIVYAVYGNFTMTGGKIANNTETGDHFDVVRYQGEINISGSAYVDAIWAAAANVTLGKLTEGAYIVSKYGLTIGENTVQTKNGDLFVYTPAVAHTQQNVRLQDLIKIGFYFNMNQNASSVGALVWTKEAYEADADRTVNSASATIYTNLEPISEGTYVVETDGVKAQNLDQVYVMIPYFVDGEEYTYGAAKEYSVLDYAKTVYVDKADDADYADARTLIIDLLNYGAAARNYFYTRDGKTDTVAPFNSILSDADKVVNWNESMRESYGTGTTDGTLDIDRYGRSASLLEAIQLNVFYTGDSFSAAKYWLDAADKKDATVSAATVSGQAMTKVSIPEIYSFNIYDDYSVQPAEGNEVGDTTVTSVAAYLTKVVDSNNDAACVALAKAMMVYGFHADTIFNQ